MTVTRHDTRHDERASFETGPGHRLREARLASNISLDEVAARLHLDSKLVEALENDQYAELPEPTFVRGYLRGYARLLNLPPAPIIESYDRHGFGAPELIPDIGSKPQAQSSDTSVRLVSFIVAGVLVALTVIWWQSQQSTLEVYPKNVDPVRGQPAALEQGPTDGEPISESAASDTSTADPSTLDAELVAPGPTPQVVLAEPAEPDSEPAPREEPVALIETAGSSAPGAENGATPDTSGDSVALPSPAPTSSRTSTTPADTSADRLVIGFEHDSWVEIHDRDETRLYLGLAKAGVKVSVSGAAPLRVLLGYARDVQIEYNGEPFDPAPFIRRDVARFTVGESTAQ